jgi:hypothetical protein
VAFFVWTVVLGKILTFDNTSCKGNLIVINRCCLCKSYGETIDYLLLLCEIACSVWYAIFSCFWLSWVMPSSVMGLFACWWMGVRFQSAIVCKMVPLYLIWCLWLERNARCFEDFERPMEELMTFFFFFYTLFTWTSVWLDPLVISYSYFLVLFSSTI